MSYSVCKKCNCMLHTGEVDFCENCDPTLDRELQIQSEKRCAMESENRRLKRENSGGFGRGTGKSKRRGTRGAFGKKKR